MNQQYEDISEGEIISMLGEADENVSNVIYAKYHYLIDAIIKKHYRIIRMYQIDKEELLCEASYGFSDGIHSFQVGKNASLKTFLSICIERRVLKIIAKYSTNKNRLEKNHLSLNYTNEMGKDLQESLTDGTDPLSNLTSIETYNEVVDVAKKCLSNFEYEVFIYMINSTNYKTIAKALDKTPKQIDNTIQRIKAKMRQALDKSSCK